MITIKDIINGQKTKGAKAYNTDLFKNDSENITESFDKNNYDEIMIIDTNIDTKTELIKETILGINKGDAYLINTQPSKYNDEITVSIFSKWLTLQGFNFFTKKMFEGLDNAFIDDEGALTLTAKEFYNENLKESGIDVSYDDILEMGEYNPQYKCVTLSATIEEQNLRVSMTINERGQLSKITKTKLDLEQKQSKDKPVMKSILD